MILIFQHLPTTKKDQRKNSFVLVWGGGTRTFQSLDGGFGFFAILGVDQSVSVLHHSATRTIKACSSPPINKQKVSPQEVEGLAIG